MARHSGISAHGVVMKQVLELQLVVVITLLTLLTSAQNATTEPSSNVTTAPNTTGTTAVPSTTLAPPSTGQPDTVPPPTPRAINVSTVDVPDLPDLDSTTIAILVAGAIGLICCICIMCWYCNKDSRKGGDGKKRRNDSERADRYAVGADRQEMQAPPPPGYGVGPAAAQPSAPPAYPQPQQSNSIDQPSGTKNPVVLV